MTLNAREEILARLKSAPATVVPARPELPPARELTLAAEPLVARFEAQLAAQGGIALRAADETALLARLEEILRQEAITRVMASTDALLAPLSLAEWGHRTGIEILTAPDYSDRGAFTRAVFDQVQAGITGADYAVAESGTLVTAHDARQPRLISLAPLVHIAVVPRARVVPTYEAAITSLFDGGRRPSQVTLITGPSMTADIQATPFKGMHGPQKLYVLLLG
jgi:L-lactate dehydrogenase complex protein LldG